jgi:hypothetical protein
MSEYHGIVINLSQKDQKVINSQNIIGKKVVIPGLLILYKIQVEKQRINQVIQLLQNNLRDKLSIFIKSFYFHFYNGEELIIVYKDKIFRIEPDINTWKEAIEYGKKLGIPEKQLDFYPYRFEDEKY